jgi:asparagine synthase (glutamine-hydrolysing)
VVSVCEADYAEAVRRFITLTGLPPHHLQSVLFGELFRLYDGDKRYLLTAQFADALFGLNSLTLPAAVLRRWGWRLPSLVARARLPAGVIPARLGLAASWSSRVTEPVGSTNGLAAHAASYTDVDFVAKVFGADLVRRRLARRLQYVLELCPFLSPIERGLDAQLEAAHLVDYFCDDAASIWRQAAMSHRGYLVCPFTHPRIVRSSLVFSRRDRYWRDGRTKPALKSVLRRRLPEYDTGLPKLSSGLPLRRFIERGPLQPNRVVTPPRPFLNGRDNGGHGYPPWITWSMLTLSTWSELVAPSPVLPPLSISRSIP